MGRDRRQAVEAAEAGGLGAVRTVHRRRNRLEGPVYGGLVVGGAGLLWLATASRWLGLLVGVLVAGAAVAGYVLAGPVDGGELRHPRVVAVCDGGLVLLSGRRAVAVPWARVGPLQVELRGVGDVVHRLPVVVPDRGEVPVELDTHGARSALVRAVQARGPVTVRRWPRGAAAGVAVVAVGLFVGRAVLPDYTTKTIDGPVRDIAGLARACEGRGARFPQAPAYEGPGPHPVLIPSADRPRRPGESAPWSPPPGEAVLVACLRLEGRAPGPGPMCSYSSSNVGIGGRVETQIMDRGRWRITVYEVRTHDEVHSAEIVGADDTCPESKLFGDDIYTAPTDDQLHEVLDPLVRPT